MPPIIRVCLLALLFTQPAASPANAQSFLEKLFGFGSSKEPQVQLPPPMPSYRAPIQLRQQRYWSNYETEAASHVSGTVRTVCVRMCDGYYFPLSNSTSARNLNTDNTRCKSTCGSDSRLFYSSANDEPDAASMIDLTGRRYDAMDTAFAYRKALRPGCSCRPPPWSSAERLRHFKYALEEAQQEMTAMAANEMGTDGKLDPILQRARETDGEGNTDLSRVAAAEGSGSEANVEGQHESEAALGPAGRPQPPAAPHERDADNSPPRRSTRGEVPPARARYSKAATPTGLGGLFGFGQQQKYVWPGDVR